ncbi:MAG TPA: hypothetical protein VGK67_01030 [Myxococcales bacterium]|jgi:hypothetical protein
MRRPFRFAAAAALVLAACPTNPPVTGPDTGVADPCAACTADQVCDQQACRFKDCQETTCKAHQACTPATGTAAAQCAAACTDGYAWDGAALVCVAPGCEQLGCASKNRECVGDAGARSCAGCLQGYAEDATSQECVTWATCDATPPQASIAADCAAKFRLCLENFPGQAACTDCLDGHVEVNGLCETKVTCAEVGCAAYDRLCEELPNAHCTTCVAGYLEDPASKNCRKPLKCKDLPACPSGQICFESNNGGDAACRSASDCGADSAPTEGGACAPCPRDCASREGGVGPYLARATKFDTCICETKPGYFWDPGNYGGIRACDADRDGWVKVQAWAVLVGDDEVLKTNARCEVRVVDRIVLHNLAGQARTVALTTALSLYESQRNDEQSLLDDAYHSSPAKLPQYPGGALKVEELNSLTKYCTPATALGQSVDFNDNGKDDVDEWQKDPSLVDASDPIKAFSDYSYFAELNRGWYEGPAAGQSAGSYHIAEKSRASNALDGQRVELHYGPLPAGKDYWRSCDLKRDSAWRSDLSKEAGMDFGQFATPVEPQTGDDLAGLPEWTGMNLSSQFKCLKIVASVDPATALPNEITKADAEANYKINTCPRTGVWGPDTLPTGAAAANPSEPSLSCTVVATVTDPGLSPNGPPVYLAAANYQPYRDQFNALSGEYVRGCVNECREHPGADPAWGKAGCPGYAEGMFNRAQCVGDTTNFGKLVCGCGMSFLGSSCEQGCPAANLMSNYTGLAPRKGTWLCGRTTLSQGVTLKEPTGATTTYKLLAEVPSLPMQKVSSCGDVGASQYCVTP